MTAPTVGYGDISPHTESGRAVGAVVIIVGTGFIALLTAAAAQRFLAAESREDVGGVDKVESTEADISQQLRPTQLERLTQVMERRTTDR